MSRVAAMIRHTRMWMVGVGVLAMVAVGGGVAVARTGGSAADPAGRHLGRGRHQEGDDQNG